MCYNLGCIGTFNVSLTLPLTHRKHVTLRSKAATVLQKGVGEKIKSTITSAPKQSRYSSEDSNSDIDTCT